MTGHRQRAAVRTMEVLAALSIPFVPVLATAASIALRRFRRGSWFGPGSRSWLLAWALIWLPSIVLALARYGRGAMELDVFLGALILLVFGPLLPALRPHQLTALWIGGLLLAGALVLERYVATTTWHPAAQSGAVSLDRYRSVFAPQEVVGGSSPRWVERRWRGLPGVTDLALDLDLRHAGGLAERAWFASDPAFVLEAIGDRPLSTHVTPPGLGEPYLTRRVMTGAPLSGRTFRVSVEVRAPEPLEFTKPECLGVLLREVGGSGAAACFAQGISTSWETRSFEWTVPEEATSQTLRVELRVPAAWYEVGATVIEEATPNGWATLGPLEPTGVRVAFAPAGSSPLAWIGPTLVPGPERTHVSVPVPPGVVSTDGDLRVLVRAEPGTTVELVTASLHGPDSAVGRPVALPQRGQLWFDHPNLAAHGIVAANLVVAALSANPLGIAAAAGVGMVGASLTGSRTAFLALVGSCALLVLVSFAHRRSGRAVAAGTMLVTLVVLGVTIGPLAPRLDMMGSGDGNQIARPEIWAFALDALLDDPWATNRISFAEAWNAGNPGDQRPAPSHAHDLWLQYGAVHGVPGLLVALAFTVGLILVVRPRRHPRVLVGVLGLLALQLTDYTLFYFPVSLALMLLVAATRDRSPDPGRLHH